MGQNKTWYVYMVECSDDTIYTGITTDVEKRVYHHNNTKSGARYTRSRRPVKLIWDTKVSGRSEAHKLEDKIKGFGHDKKRQLSEGKVEI